MTLSIRQQETANKNENENENPNENGKKMSNDLEIARKLSFSSAIEPQQTIALKSETTDNSSNNEKVQVYLMK